MPLCLLEDGEHACTDAAGFRTSAGDLVGIDGLGGIGIRMAQLVGGGHGIDTAGNQNGCYRMTECVWVDVGQTLGLAEFIQPVSDASSLGQSPCPLPAADAGQGL